MWDGQCIADTKAGNPKDSGMEFIANRWVFTGDPASSGVAPCVDCRPEDEEWCPEHCDCETCNN